MLLISGALPAKRPHGGSSADHRCRSWRPLHFIASVVGALLLVVAHGLLRRLKSAWTLATALLASGAVFSVAKGFDFEEAIICVAVAGLLYAGRRGLLSPGRIPRRAVRAPGASGHCGRHLCFHLDRLHGLPAGGLRQLRCGGISPITATRRASFGRRSASR